MTDRSRDIALGLTAVLALAGLGWLLMAFGELKLFAPPQYELRVHLPDAGGITGASNVTLNGVVVGRVASAATESDPHEGVILTLAIQDGVRVPRDVEVQIQQDFIGPTRLALLAKKGEPTDAGFFSPGDTFERSARGRIEQLTDTLTERLDDIAEAADSFKKLSETYVRVGEKIEAVLEPRSPGDVDSGAGPATLPSTLARLDAAISNANAWLGDGAMRTDAAGAITSAKTILEKASDAVDSWKAAAETVTSRSATLADQTTEAMRSFTEATAQLNALLGETRTMVNDVAAGKGTIGLLATNPDLYNSLNSAAERLEQALREAQLLIEKFKAEGVPVQF